MYTYQVMGEEANDKIIRECDVKIREAGINKQDEALILAGGPSKEQWDTRTVLLLLFAAFSLGIALMAFGGDYTIITYGAPLVVGGTIVKLYHRWKDSIKLFLKP